MKLISGLLLLLVLAAALNTRLGVFLIFDGVGDWFGPTDDLVLDAGLGPLHVDRIVGSTSQHALPASIEQASGIAFSDQAVYLSTDQAELFELAMDFSDQRGRSVLLSGPLLLKQGALEAITARGGEIFGAGEFGAVARWQKVDNSWRRGSDIALAPGFDEVEFSGLTRDDNGVFFAVSGESAVVYRSDQATPQPIDFGDFVKAERSTEELMFSGISYAGGRLYVVTENYASILVLWPAQLVVERVLGLDPIEASDIAVHSGRAYVTVDHNLFDDRPPIHVYELD